MMKLTTKQEEAQNILVSPAIYLMLFGGSRSGKTFLLIRSMVLRAIKAPFSRHCILRFRFNHIKSSVVFDTFPKVMSLCFPEVKYKLDKVDWRAILPNGSEIWFGGLDDKERTEKILGNEYVTIYLNESSQISWASVGLVVTRLAQKVMQVINGAETGFLKPRMYFDCNPPSKLHWAYNLFIKKVDPDTKLALPNAQDYISFQINPEDNVENLDENYLNVLKGLSSKLQARFLKGEWADGIVDALFTDETIDKWRVLDGSTPKLLRIVVAVDPSGAGDTDNADNDAIGIIVAGLGIDGNAYILEDCTVKAGPSVWGNIATTAFDRHKADCIVGEVNYGGAMVQQTIQVSRPRTPFISVTASRGKHVRAEPFSALYEIGKVRHVGFLSKLEEELTAFTTIGFVGPNSPNRADAAIWALTALFPALTRPKDDGKKVEIIPVTAKFNKVNR